MQAFMYLRGIPLQGELYLEGGDRVFLYAATTNEDREKEANELFDVSVVGAMYAHILKILPDGKFEVMKSRRYEPGVVIDNLMKFTT